MAYFQPNCTLPPDGTSYVASPNVRSTLDILWTSLVTIIACTWSVLHPNVPEQRGDRDPGWIGDLKWTAKRSLKKLKWCIITILMPEFILTKAVSDQINARKQLRRLHGNRPDAWGRVELTHMIFADLGGFVLRYRPEESRQCPETDATTASVASNLARSPQAKPSEIVSHGNNDLQTECDNSGESGSQHVRESSRYRAIDTTKQDEDSVACFQSHKERVSTEQTELVDPISLESPIDELRPSDVENRMEPHFELWRLDAYVLRRLVEDGWISPRLTSVADISDKSKSDALTKTLVLLQICYFVLAVIVRVSTGLSVCMLERGTSAFVIRSAVTYIANFPKPLAPETAIVLPVTPSKDLMAFAEKEQKKSPEISIRFPWFLHRTAGTRLYNYTWSESANHVTSVYLIFAALSVFNSIHLLGWKSSFPSEVDRWIWRASAIVSTAAFPLWFLASVCLAGLQVFLEDALRSLSCDFIGDIFWKFGFTLMIIYDVARVALIVEIFRGLTYLPPEVFLTTWTANIPHIG